LIKKTYLFFQIITIFALFIATVAIFILFQKDIVPYFAQKYLKEHKIEYSLIEGTLYSGVVIKDFKYEESIKIDELRVNYNLLMLIHPTPRIEYIGAKGVTIDADKILKSSSDKEQESKFAFNISKIDVKNANINYKNKLYTFNLEGSDFSFRDKIDLEKIELELKTSYGLLSLNGQIKSNNLKAQSTVLIDKKIKSKYLYFLTYTPEKFDVDLDVSMKKISLKTSLKKIIFKDVENLELNNTNINLIYKFKDDFFVVNSDYGAFYERSEIFVKQETLVTFDLKVDSKLDAEIIKDELNLPFKNFALKINKDENFTKIDFDAQDIEVNTKTKDYKNFILKADTKYAYLDGIFERDNNASTLHGQLYPKKEAPFIKEYYHDKFSKINLFVSKDQDTIRGNINADIFSLTLFNDDKGALKGLAKMGSSKFNIEGDLNKRVLNIDSELESLNTLLYELDLNALDEDMFFDAKATIKADISYKDTLEIKTRLNVPWYKVKLDAKTIYTRKDAFFEFFYKNSQATLQRYGFKVANYNIYSNRASKIILNEKGELELKEFWVYDNLLLRGILRPSDMSADINIKSDKFHYKSDDANVTLKMDLQASIDSSGKQNVTGDITVLDGIVTYAPKKEHVIGDEDIIIIQDIKPEKKKVDRALNISINSLKPIKYKIKEADLLFTPNLTLYQETSSPMQILGTVQINKGTVNISDRVFEFDESEIYFADDKYTNPYLNLNLHYYTLDNIDIEIYITNRVNSPVIIFASNPQMSQEDIMSYILFGAAASSVFDTSEDSSKTSLSNLLLGVGLKEMLNKSTNLKIDTLNILTNEEGTLGYEIGTRFGKNIRLVYRNDEISTIILQYSISKSIRIDVDVKETGQGVGIYYIKDFKLKE
jgi:translocation and assembly module TamB